MAEQDTFRGGNATPDDKQNRTPKEQAAPVDEYGGQYKQPTLGESEQQKFGTNEYPVQNDALPAKNLKSTGG